MTLKKVLFILFATALVWACADKKSAEVRHDAAAEAMMSGLWINEEDEEVVFNVKNDTLYYADSNAEPMAFHIYNDTLFLDGRSKAKYAISKLTQHLLVFTNQHGEEVRLVKSADRELEEAINDADGIDVDINQELIKADTVVFYDNEKYHCYVQVNPTSYKVVKTELNDEGMGVGKVYYDNIINLTVYKNGDRLFSSDFNKNDFAKLVPAEILPQCILNNIMYSAIGSDGVTFQAQLKMPDSASAYIPNIIISFDGNKRIAQSGE